MQETRDDLPTLTAIGLLAYLVADLSHHLLGHGGACLWDHGRILLLSSIVLKCSKLSPLIDFGGPAANFVVGFVAMASVRFRMQSTLRLLLILVAAFNLFWFAGQMVVSVATGSDDWAWPLSYYHLEQPARVLLMATGVGIYLLVVRTLASVLADFPLSRERMVRVCLSAWFAAAALAAATALLDAHPLEALVKHALPQGLLVPLGLWRVPARALQHEAPGVAVIDRSWALIAAGILGALVSLVCLGRGIALA